MVERKLQRQNKMKNGKDNSQTNPKKAVTTKTHRACTCKAEVGIPAPVALPQRSPPQPPRSLEGKQLPLRGDCQADADRKRELEHQKELRHLVERQRTDLNATVTSMTRQLHKCEAQVPSWGGGPVTTGTL